METTRLLSSNLDTLPFFNTGRGRERIKHKQAGRKRKVSGRIGKSLFYFTFVLLSYCIVPTLLYFTSLRFTCTLCFSPFLKSPSEILIILPKINKQSTVVFSINTFISLFLSIRFPYDPHEFSSKLTETVFFKIV